MLGFVSRDMYIFITFLRFSRFLYRISWIRNWTCKSLANFQFELSLFLTKLSCISFDRSSLLKIIVTVLSNIYFILKYLHIEQQRRENDGQNGKRNRLRKQGKFLQSLFFYTSSDLISFIHYDMNLTINGSCNLFVYHMVFLQLYYDQVSSI